MHTDIVTMTEVKRPHGDISIVYFSSRSNNTHRFVEKLSCSNIHRIPVKLSEAINVDEPYILFCPTYSGGSGDTAGAVPKQVIKFLNNPDNRKHCYGVIASGNTNFNDTFCLAGTILTSKLKVPLLYQFELLGTHSDVNNVDTILNKFYQTQGIV